MAYILASRLATRRLLGFQTTNPLFGFGSRAFAKREGAIDKLSCVQHIKQREDETHDDKNARLGRPLSPHLSIYAPQLTSILSILHRITGTVGGIYLMAFAACAFYLPYDFCSVADYIECLGPPQVLVWLCRAVLAFPFVYHTCNGVRHLAWDTGNFFSMPVVTKTGLAMLTTQALVMVIVVFLL